MHSWEMPETAAAWDISGGSGLPTRADQQQLLLALLSASQIGGDSILDLGIGSGLVAEAVLDKLPRAELVGVDVSLPMLDLARNRLTRFGSRVHLYHGNLAAPEKIELPPRHYRAAFSVQTLHHLDDRESKRHIRGSRHA